MSPASVPLPSTIVTTGGVRLTLPGSLAVPSLPAGSFTDASTVYGPSGSGFGTSTLYVPSGCTGVVTVCVTPSLPLITSVTVLPAGASVVPVIVGVVSGVLSGASTVINGLVRLTLPGSLAVPSLPAGFFTDASTVYGPSGSGFGTSTLYVPSGCTGVVTVCVTPSLPLITSVTVLPAGASVVPVIVGVVSGVLSGASTVINGLAGTGAAPPPPPPPAAAPSNPTPSNAGHQKNGTTTAPSPPSACPASTPSPSMDTASVVSALSGTYG